MSPSVDDPWSRISPTQLARELRGAGDIWWIAGGWSLELFTAATARGHDDIDISCFRDDLARLRRTLADCSYHATQDGRLRPLAPDEAVAEDVNTLWCRLPGSRFWDFEVMIEQRRGDEWCFRRDPAARLPVPDLTWTQEDGMRVVRPEVQLLYKAKDVRPRDERDFRAVLAHLSGTATRWLSEALARVHPGHTWLDEIRRAEP